VITWTRTAYSVRGVLPHVVFVCAQSTSESGYCRAQFFARVARSRRFASEQAIDGIVPLARLLVALLRRGEITRALREIHERMREAQVVRHGFVSATVIPEQSGVVRHSHPPSSGRETPAAYSSAGSGVGIVVRIGSRGGSRFGIAGELYSQEFYDQLARTLRRPAWTRSRCCLMQQSIERPGLVRRNDNGTRGRGDHGIG